MTQQRLIYRIGVLFIAILLTLNHLQAQKRNIIFLFADDAGYNDFGFQGSKTFKTPNLDKLASEGVICKQAYTTAAVCGPSRAGLLTGQYQQRFGYEENNVPGYMSKSSYLNGDEMGLPVGIKTIADYLKPLGYQSIILGKWHLGNADKYHPLNRGFDEFYGFRGGARSYFPLTVKQAIKLPENRMERGFGFYEEPEKYVTDAIADEACAFMDRNKDKPFFMYVSFNAVHGPLQATEEDLKQVENLGLEGKRKTLAAMNVALDRACGTILDKLEELGLEDNTLVIFTNDNGGPDVNLTSNYPLSGCKATHLEGGLRVPFIARLPGAIEPGSTYNQAISMLDMLPTFVNLAGGQSDNIEGLDGVDLIPYLSGENTTAPHNVLFWKKENRGTILKGDWKLMRFPDRPAELYNLSNDITESKNLAYKNPELVKEMYKELFEWEGQLERPLWQLKRIYEVNAIRLVDEKRTPLVDELNK